MIKSSPGQSVQRVLHELRPRLLTVQRTHLITPRMLRVTLAGDDLSGFQTAAPTDHIKLVFPQPGDDQPIMPSIGAHGLKKPSDGASQPLIRDYTVRSFRPDSNELDVDFVLHGDGPAVAWAQQAAPGQRLGVLGPRGSQVVSTDFDWYLLAGDETALPAIARWLEELPSGTQVFSVIEVTDAAEQQRLSTHADLTLIWLYRDGQEAGTTTLLVDAIRSLDLPAGNGFAWVAGEADTLRPVRRYLRQELGMTNDRVDVDGYWRRGTADFDHHMPIED